jgi:hypothetical protein
MAAGPFSQSSSLEQTWVSSYHRSYFMRSELIPQMVLEKIFKDISKNQPRTIYPVVSKIANLRSEYTKSYREPISASKSIK